MYQLRSQQVRIANLKLYGFHGVLQQEHAVGAYYTLNVVIDTDFSRAIATDELDGTISYADVYDTIIAEMAVPSQLLEHVAGRICHALLDRFPTAQAVHLEILKENPPMGADCQGAGVSLEVCRQQ